VSKIVSRIASVLPWLLMAVTASVAAETRFAIVVDSGAPELERLAAAEMAGQLTRLFNAEAEVTRRVPPEPGHLVLIGSPRTSAHVKAAVASRRPAISPQGLVVKKMRYLGREVLVVGGGTLSPPSGLLDGRLPSPLQSWFATQSGD
jgi:hypothetical protein